MRLKERVAFGFAGFMIMGMGAGTLLLGRLHYRSWWHDPVFAPFALIVGALTLFMAIKGGQY